MFVSYSRKKYKSINLDRCFYKLLVDLVSRVRQGKSENIYWCFLFLKTKGIEHCFVGVEDGIIWSSEAGEMACKRLTWIFF